MLDPQVLRHARLQFSRRAVVRPVALFAAVFLVWLATVAAILMLPLYASIVLVPLCGVLAVTLFVIGHDAGHHSLTPSPALNRWIGRLALLPSLHAFSLWQNEHNQRHHRFNNIRHLDYAWVPLSVADYRALGPLGRARYRLYRSPLGVLVYYLLEIWAQRKIVPRPSLLGRVRSEHVFDCVLVWVFALGGGALMAVVGGWFGKSPVVAVTLALVLPFLIFSAAISFAVFLHHTHYSVPWYRSVDEWERDNGAVHGTVHVEFPRLVRAVFLNIMEHTAHHYAPGVPHYALQSMQDIVVAHPHAFAWDWSLRGYLRICSRCKLYDYDTARWLNFRGEVTSTTLRSDRAGADADAPAAALAT